MATFVVTIKDPAKVIRIMAAFGATDPATGQRTPATPDQVAEELRNVIRARVANHEAQAAAQNATTLVSSEVWN